MTRTSEDCIIDCVVQWGSCATHSRDPFIDSFAQTWKDLIRRAALQYVTVFGCGSLDNALGAELLEFPLIRRPDSASSNHFAARQLIFFQFEPRDMDSWYQTVSMVIFYSRYQNSFKRHFYLDLE